MNISIGLNMVKECIVLLLSGASIPLAFFPEALRNIVQYLPFRCIYDTPLNVLLQKPGYTLAFRHMTSLTAKGTIPLSAISRGSTASASRRLFWTQDSHVRTATERSDVEDVHTATTPHSTHHTARPAKVCTGRWTKG